MRDEDLAREAKRLIDALASSARFAGSAEESEARRLCIAELRAAGFEPRETQFEFSEWPGRFGIPSIAAGILAVILLMAASATLAPNAPITVGLLVIVLGQLFISRKRNVATLGMKRRRSRSTNLEARRGKPRVWLAAHLDSKSQTVPMLVRVVSYVALVVALALAFVVAFLELLGWLHPAPWNAIAIIGTLSALPSLLCLVGNKSPGALDNASGVAAVLLAARLIPAEKEIGVLITSGEELDLAGARAWAAQAPPGTMVINCDTVDDSGAWRCMYVTERPSLADAAATAAKKLGLALRMGKVIPGIITDTMAFEAAGMTSVTLSRGTLTTLARLHTSGDRPDRMRGSGAAVAARILAQMAEELV